LIAWWFLVLEKVLMAAVLSSAGKIPELRRRVLFTLGLLAVYRLGVFVSSPGIDVNKLKQMFEGGSGTLFGLVNMFSGGALENFSIFTLGIAPYISVSIIIQLLTPSIPALDQLKKEGDAGKRTLTRYTRIGTVILALFQGYVIALGLESQGLALSSGVAFRLTTAITLTAGTAFIMWLGEQISEKGIGNGISIVIFAGIVARMPEVFLSTVVLARTGAVAPTGVLFIFLFCIATVAAIVFVERSHRRVPVQYPKRMVGKNMAQAQTQYMPLKVNMAGVIPPIFASALLILPSYALGFSGNEIVAQILQYLTPGAWVYEVLFAILIVIFCFFYTSIIFNPEEVAENLKKNGGFIPTVRPGKQTSEYLYKILNRLTVWGSLYIAAVCIVPQVVYIELGVTDFAYVFGGTAILIVVGVTLDTASQIESLVVARNYEAFMSKSAKSRGGMGSFGYTRARLLRR
jgi:preprotein translocase subunit SecY